MSQRIEGVGAIEPAFYDDFTGLQAITRQPDGLEAAASQFEVQFLQTVLKHMRAASDALQDEESLFSSQQQGFYRDLYDSQLAMGMVHKGGLGLKDQIVAQMAPTLKNSHNSVAVPQHGSESFRQSLHQVKRKPD